ncbi:hypothetical protein ACFQ4Z_12650 [Oceanobacillus oncorhynchi subsp. oncorhynchi]|uniref:hypothetical protein n=1 Tax=Oceanobacillus oncorhynchi TaxID=545501 RepID=UPI0036375CF5
MATEIDLITDMEQEELDSYLDYTKYRTTNVMRMTISKQSMYWYIKPTTKNCKCTFIDGSVYYQQMIKTDSTWTIRSDGNTLYIDEDCTLKAPVTRKQKLYECKKAGLKVN